MGTEIGEFRLGHPIRILLRVFLLELLTFQPASVRRRRRFHASDLLKRGEQSRGLGRNRNRRSIKIAKGGSFRRQRLIEGGEAGRGGEGEGECLVRAGLTFRRCCCYEHAHRR